MAGGGGVVAGVPYSAGPKNNTGQALSRFDQGFGMSVGLANDFSARLDSVLNSITGAVNKLKSVGGSPPDPRGAPAAPVLPTAPSVEVDYSVPDAPLPLTIGDMPEAPRINLQDPNLPQPELCGDIGDITPNFPAAPAVPTVDTSIPDADIPVYEDSTTITNPPPAPVLNIPPAPTADDVTVTLPDAPDLSKYLSALPDVPPLDLPVVDDSFYDVPDFTVTVPDAPDVPAFALPSFTVDEFVSELKDTLDAAVTDMVTNAQLDAEYERASFDAVLAREAEAARLAMGRLPQQWAARGFQMPPGMMLQAEVEIRREMERKAREGSRDIYVRRKELELQTRQAGLSAGVQLVAQEVQLHEINNRLRQAAVEFASQQMVRHVELLLRGYELTSQAVRLRVDVYRAQLEALRSKWDSFKVRVDAELAKLEVVNAQIRAIASQVEVGRAEAQVYSATVDAQVKVAQLSIEVNKLQFESWNAEVSAQVEQLRAYASYGDIIRAQAAAIDARARAYQAQVQGVVAQTEARVAQVRANTELAQIAVSLYDAQVRAEAARISALADVIRTKAATQEAAARYAIAYAQALVAYREGEARVNTAYIQSVAASYQAKVNAHAAEQNAYLAWYNAHASRLNVVRAKADIEATFYRAVVDSIITAYRATVDAVDRVYSQALSTWSTSVQRALSAIQSTVSAASSAAQFASRVAAAALSQVVVQLGSSEQVSYSEYAAWQYSLSNSLNESISI